MLSGSSPNCVSIQKQAVLWQGSLKDAEDRIIRKEIQHPRADGATEAQISHAAPGGNSSNTALI